MKFIPKRFFPRPLFILMLLAFSGIGVDSGLKAQNIIGFSSTGFSGMPSSVYAGDTALAGAFVKNYSNINYPLSDTIQILGYIDSIAGPNSKTYFSLPPQDSVPNLTSGDSAFFLQQIIFKDNFQGGGFRIGNNVIVVWPIMFNSNFSTGDSARANVLVIDTINSTGPEHLGNQYDVRCYPVPSAGPLYITSNSRNSQPKKVVVHDANGKVVCVSDNLSSGLDTYNWAPGIYFLEVIFDDGQSSHIKIMRQ